MKEIVRTNLISSRDYDYFCSLLNSTINEMQELGLEVDIQYQMSNNVPSALVVGKREID